MSDPPGLTPGGDIAIFEVKAYVAMNERIEPDGAGNGVRPGGSDTVAPISCFLVRRADIAVIEVLARGAGPRVVLLPSLGRGAEDFEPIATAMAAAGMRVLCPQPRGIGQSHGCAYQDLEDCAEDIAAVIEGDGGGPSFLAGHAFGNRVSRLLATDRPDLVAAVSLIAANVGHAPSPPKVRAAIRNSANAALPREVRLEALRFAFFAPGNDPEPWLEGWYPEVLALQRAAGDRTSRQRDYAGGGKPILYLQPSHDPLAHVEDAEIFRRENGARVKVVIVPNASHAAIVEQPDFIATELIAFARQLWSDVRIAAPDSSKDDAGAGER